MPGHDGGVANLLEVLVSKMNRVVAVFSEIRHDPNAQSHIDQEFHAAGAPVVMG